MVINHLKKYAKLYIAYLIVTLCIIGFSLQWIRVFSFDNVWHGFLMISTFFTNHSVVFVFISTLLLILGFQSKHVDRFAYVTAVDITITCIVFFTLLLPFMDHVSFLQILLHGIIPPIYLMYYFIAYRTSLTPKHAWISLIHPTLYFIFVYTFVHPVYGEKLHNLYPNEFGAYVYPFLNPVYFDRGFLGVILSNFLILFP